MKARVTYDLPYPDDDTLRLIEKAREIGYPMLTVEIEVDASFDDAPADGMTMEAVQGLALGERISELTAELDALTHHGIVKKHAYIVAEEVSA